MTVWISILLGALFHPSFWVLSLLGFCVFFGNGEGFAIGLTVLLMLIFFALARD